MAPGPAGHGGDPQALDGRNAAIARQELVFIGQHLDFAQLDAELGACLLNDEEMALGAEGWQRLPDPFGDWHDEEAA